MPSRHLQNTSSMYFKPTRLTEIKWVTAHNTVRTHLPRQRTKERERVWLIKRAESNCSCHSDVQWDITGHDQVHNIPSHSLFSGVLLLFQRSTFPHPLSSPRLCPWWVVRHDTVYLTSTEVYSEFNNLNFILPHAPPRIHYPDWIIMLQNQKGQDDKLLEGGWEGNTAREGLDSSMLTIKDIKRIKLYITWDPLIVEQI